MGDSRTGEFYESREAALAAGVPESSLFEFSGPSGAQLRVQAALQAQADEERRLIAKAKQRKRHANDHPLKVKA